MVNAATRTRNGREIETKGIVKTKNAVETGNERKAATGKPLEETEVMTRNERQEGPSIDLNLEE